MTRSSRMGHLAAAALALVMSRAPAVAHGMDYALRGSGEVRVVFRYTSGPPMIGAAYRVFAPGESDAVAIGTTDSAGEAGFRATRDGRWRIEASDDTGQAVRARVDVADGVATLASRRIPDWLAAVSLALNILLIAGLALGRRWRRAPRAAAGRTELPNRPATSPSS